MITRYAFFRGEVSPGRQQDFKTAVMDDLLPTGLVYPGATAVRVSFATERDDQAPDVPLILAVDVASREGPELAPDNQERLDSDAATERVLPGLVTGNIFHHVAEATENCRDQAVLTLILVTSACPLLARANGRSNRIFMNSIA